MKYLCLAYHEAAARDAVIIGASDSDQELRESGHYIASSPLQSAESVTTIRVRNGHMSITDGPFATTKDQLGGFYLIEAADLNDAIRVASKLPPAYVGCIEVRPLMEFEFDSARWDGGLDFLESHSIADTC